MNLSPLKPFFALRTKQNSCKNVTVFYFQSMSIWNRLTSVSQGSWFRRAAGFAGQLVSRGSWFYRGAGFAGKLVSQGSWFLDTLAKIFIIILVVKQITYNAKFN